jgi:hypothetical protein
MRYLESHLGWRAGPKFACWNVEFATENPHIARRIERQRHTVARNPTNLEHDIFADVNPFTNFST